jgi:CzcA family heavy metal efflux pump
MWIVRLALKRPYSCAVLVLLLVVLGPLAVLRTPTDVFPNIDIPVVAMVWKYTGLSPEQMAYRITSLSERSLTTTVNGIEHTESQSLNGIAIVKIFFQPNVNISMAVTQVSSIAQTILRQLPPGAAPPLVIQYNASSVPILQLSLSGQGLSEQQLNDYGVNFIRPQLVTVSGAGLPYPYGGKTRQVQVDLDLPALQSKGLSPTDVVEAITAQNLIAPSGTAKIGPFEYQIETNSSLAAVSQIDDLPIRSINGAMVYVRDVAHVRDGFPPQTNIVRVDGQRSALLSVIKTGTASTLDIVAGVRAKAEDLLSQLPPGFKIMPLADQSLFVRASISGVVREGVIAACLTAIMILIFLGSWRSTVIIAVSIPLSILSSLLVLSALGETINIMTLGGLALAVGILVDDATVEVENINRNLEQGKPLEQAILDGASQIAVPALVSTICICIVFVPMFFLGGVARYLFVPLAEAVCFAMLASYFFSRTIVPVMAKYLLKAHGHRRPVRHHALMRVQLAFERQFERLRRGYHRVLETCLGHARAFLAIFVVLSMVSAALLYPFLGQDFFPTVDSGQFKLHMRARSGTRIEDVARLSDEVDNVIRQTIPAGELGSIIDNIGLPYSGINNTYSNSAPIGPADADIQVSLKPGHRPTDEYVQELRAKLARSFPGVTFYTLPVDMVTQVLNFGLPAPIDVQISGPNLPGNRALAERLLKRMKTVAGTADLHIHQPFDNPELTVNIDRVKAQLLGFQQQDVAGALLTATNGSFQTSPSYWMNPLTGVSYNIAVQAPQYNLETLQDLQNIPLNAPGAAAKSASMGGRPAQMLGSVASIKRGAGLGTVSHYDIAPVIDIYGNVFDTDLASVAVQIDRIVADAQKELPRGSHMTVRGQVQTMRTSFVGLMGGLAFSIFLVYLLIVVNFQSWLDSLIIVSALPAALAGVIWFLFVTHTHLSVPALTGSIMCMGVATANSILVISFAREQLAAGRSAPGAALAAGFVRFRPVLMTALAMIIGMVPMALGLGEGGEQNAPLGRAVIGGLLLATVSTLFFVPTLFSVMHGWRARRRQARVVPS